MAVACALLAACAPLRPGVPAGASPGLAGSDVSAGIAAAGAPPELSARVGEQRGADAIDTPFVATAPGGQNAAHAAGEIVVGLAAGAAPPLDLGPLGKAVVKDEVFLPRRYALLGLPAGADPARVAAAMAAAPGVVSASANHRAVLRFAPTDDLLLPAQWAFEPEVADVYGAWSKLPGETASASRWTDTVVAVVDSGVDAGHPDLNVLPGFAATGATASGSNVPTDAADGEGHGTGVAGIVGARKGGANIGAAGIVPNIRILPIRVTDEFGGASDFAMVRGLLYAAYYNRSDSPHPNLAGAGGKVRVVNMSVGPLAVHRSQIFDDALEFLRRRGILVTVAAGNFGVDGRVEIPANSPAAVGVSATMQYLGFEMLAPYSSRGPEIWVAGPGNYLWSTAPKGAASDYSAAYTLFNGTSSAAPFVAGVAAAINLLYGSGQADQDTPQWADRVKRRLADTADDLGNPGFDHQYGYGRVNARRALEGALP